MKLKLHITAAALAAVMLAMIAAPAWALPPNPPTDGRFSVNDIYVAIHWTRPSNAIGHALVTRYRIESAQTTDCTTGLYTHRTVYAHSTFNRIDLRFNSDSYPRGHYYCFRVFAESIRGDSLPTRNIGPILAPLPPNPPTNGRFEFGLNSLRQPAGLNTITIFWTHAVHETGRARIRGYYVRREQTETADCAAVAYENTVYIINHRSSDPFGNSHFDSQNRVMPGKPYCYRVSTVWDAVLLREHPSITIGPVILPLPPPDAPEPEPTPPDAPAPPELTAVDHQSIRITWAAPADDGGSAITGYELQRKLASAADSTYTAVSLAGDGLGLTHTDTGLAAETEYAYRVRAVNEIDRGDFSPATTATTEPEPAPEPEPTPPDAPAPPELTAVDHQSIRITWAAPADDGGSAITGYELQRKLASAADSTYTAVSLAGDGLGLTHTDTGLAAETEYAYRVRAVNEIDRGDFSPATTATTEPEPAPEPEPTPPDAPAPPELTAVDHQSIRITWATPDDGGSAITEYELQRKVAAAADSTYTAVSLAGDGLGLTHTDAGLAAETEYAYRVAAVNSIGRGAFSTAATATTAPEPTPPEAPAEEMPGDADEFVLTIQAFDDMITKFELAHRDAKTVATPAGWVLSVNARSRWYAVDWERSTDPLAADHLAYLRDAGIGLQAWHTPPQSAATECTTPASLSEADIIAAGYSENFFTHERG